MLKVQNKPKMTKFEVPPFEVDQLLHPRAVADHHHGLLHERGIASPDEQHPRYGQNAQEGQYCNGEKPTIPKERVPIRSPCQSRTTNKRDENQMARDHGAPEEELRIAQRIAVVEAQRHCHRQERHRNERCPGPSHMIDRVVVASGALRSVRNDLADSEEKTNVGDRQESEGPRYVMS